MCAAFGKKRVKQWQAGPALGTGAVSGLPQPIPGPRFPLSHIFRLQNQWVFGEVTLRTGCSQRSQRSRALPGREVAALLDVERSVSTQNGRSG